MTSPSYTHRARCAETQLEIEEAEVAFLLRPLMIPFSYLSAPRHVRAASTPSQPASEGGRAPADFIDNWKLSPKLQITLADF